MQHLCQNFAAIEAFPMGLKIDEEGNIVLRPSLYKYYPLFNFLILLCTKVTAFDKTETDLLSFNPSGCSIIEIRTIQAILNQINLQPKLIAVLEMMIKD